MSCPDENTLAELAAETLDTAARERIVAHVDTCSDCRELVALLAPPPSAVPSLVTSGGAEPFGGHAVLRRGEELGHYRILDLIGRGGMGEVYRAHDTSLARVVALKVVRFGGFDDAQARARFLREARAMARVNHPNIVTIYGVGEHAGLPFVAMEYVKGQPLRNVAGRAPLGLHDTLRIARAIADALVEAHRRGVVHRDLKPENVLLGDDGRIRVLDFGLARMVVPGEENSFAETIARSGDEPTVGPTGVAGTPHYMAPEQWIAGEATLATDVWSFGVMVFEMCSARLPFDADNLVDLSRLILSGSPPAMPPSMPDAMAALVSWCLSHDPAQRPAAPELLEHLQGIEAQLPPAATAISSPQVLAPPVARNPAWAVAVAVAALAAAAVGAAVVLAWLGRAPSPPSSSNPASTAEASVFALTDAPGPTARPSDSIVTSFDSAEAVGSASAAITEPSPSGSSRQPESRATSPKSPPTSLRSGRSADAPSIPATPPTAAGF